MNQGGTIFMFALFLGGGYLALRTIAGLASAASGVVQDELQEQPFHDAPGAPSSGFVPAPSDPSGFVPPASAGGITPTAVNGAVMGSALGYGPRYMGDPYFSE